MKRCMTAMLLVIGASLPVVAEAGIVVHASHIPGFERPTAEGVVTADFDGDGVEDIAVGGQQIGLSPNGSSHTGLVGVVRFDAASGAYSVQSTVAVEQPLARLLRVPGQQRIELVAVGFDGEVSRLGGWPLKRLSTLQFGRGRYVRDAAVGDIDNNGRLELVLATSTAGTSIHDLDTGALLDSSLAHMNAATIVLEQLDADPALELIFTGASFEFPPGHVIDGATRAVDWTFAGGFGQRIRTGAPLGGTSRGFLGGFRTYYTVFGSLPYQPVSSTKVQGITGLELLDIDLDGRDEIVHGSPYSGFRILDAASGAVLHASSRIAGGRMGLTRNASSPVWQMAFGGNLDATARHYLEIVGDSDQILLRRDEERSPFTPALPADLDGDGQLELAWISSSPPAGEAGGALRITRFSSGEELWRMSLNDPDMPASSQSLRAISVAPAISGHSHRELLVARGRFLDYVDPLTRTVRLSVDSGVGEKVITRLLFDTAADSVIAVADRFQIRLARFERATLSPLQSADLPAVEGYRVNDVTLHRASPTEGRLLISTDSSFLMLDADSFEILWRLSIPAAGAVVVPAGASASHIHLLGLDGRMRKVGFDGTVLAIGKGLGTELVAGLAIDPVDHAGRMFACIDRSIVTIDIESMALDERSETIGGGTCENGGLHVVPGAGPQERRVIAGSSVGVFDLRWFEDAIFAHGFD